MATILEHRDALGRSAQALQETGELVGELRVITSGLNREDRVVIGDLWRAVPGNKIVPQLTVITPPSGSSGAPRP